MRMPTVLKVRFLCLDKLTGHGAADSSEATVVPMPRRTSTEGSAQQMSVLNELKREK